MKKSCSTSVSGVGGVSKMTKTSSMKVLGSNEGRPLVSNKRSSLADKVKERDRKRLRSDEVRENSQRVLVRRTCDAPRHGLGKSLTITGIRKDGLPSVFQSVSQEKSIVVEIQPHERWSAGPNILVHAFDAFNLPQDFSSYVVKSRSEIANRCFARLGRFLADLSHIIHDYKADVDGHWRESIVQEMSGLRDVLSATEKKVSDAEDRAR